MSSKAIKNNNKTKSKKKLDTMGSSISSKDKTVTGEASLLTPNKDVEEKTGGELIMSMLKNAKKSVKKVVRSLSPPPAKKEEESPSLHSIGVLPETSGVSTLQVIEAPSNNNYGNGDADKRTEVKVSGKDQACVKPSFDDVMEELEDIRSFNLNSREMIMTSIERLSEAQITLFEGKISNAFLQLKEELFNKLNTMQALNDERHSSMLSEISKVMSSCEPCESVSENSKDDMCAYSKECVEYANKLLSSDDAILSKSWGAILQYASNLDALSQAQLIEKISAGNNDLVSAICDDCGEKLDDMNPECEDDKDNDKDLSFEEKKAIFEVKPMSPEMLNEGKMSSMFRECSSLLGKDWSYDSHLDHLTVGGLKIHIKIDEEIGTPYVFTAKNSMPKKKVSFFSVLEGKEYVECQYQSSPENHDVLSYVSRIFTQYIEEFNKANVVTV